MILLLLIVIGLVVWGFSNADTTRTVKKKTEQDNTSRALQANNQGWIDFIAAYASLAKTKSEKSLIARMLADIEWQRVGAPSEHTTEVHVASSLAQQEQAGGLAFGTIGGEFELEPVGSGRSGTNVVAAASAADTPKNVLNQPVQLDNASLLLYFGAFLFVASAGLFVAFGDALGVLKVLIVLFVAMAMYASGIWLYYHRPKLHQAGQAFAAIGIVLAPMVGVATYAYAFDHQYGNAIWLATSLLCLVMYVHALKIFKTPLMGYVFIFTFLSLFESSIGITGVPVYVYGWGLAAMGIGLQLLGRWKGWWPELREPSRFSSQAFLPLALLVSIVAVQQLGAVQLGVTLLLAAVFYGMEIPRSTGENQEANAIATQVAATAGISALVYGYGHSWAYTSLLLIAVNFVQLGLLFAYKEAKATHKLWINFASVLMAMSLASGLLVFNHPKHLLLATLVTTVIGACVWIRQRRPEAYVLASLTWMALSFVYGILVASFINAEAQTFLGLAALTVLLLAYFEQYKKVEHIKQWADAAAGSYIVGTLSVLVTSMFAGPFFCLAVTLAVATFAILLAEHDKRVQWPELASLMLVAPLIRAWDDPTTLLVAVVVVLAVLIALTLNYRRELMRWMSTGVWLLLPFALGYSELGCHWPPAAYAYAYLVAMFGLIFSRAIARGVIFLSGKVPISTMMHNASVSYVGGYVFAAVLSVGLSVASTHSQLHTSIILAVLIATTMFLGKYVEKRDDVAALLPIMMQALLLSAIRPLHSDALLDVFLLLSTALACMSYATTIGQKLLSASKSLIAQVSLATAFIAPAMVLFADVRWGMPLGLLAAGALLLHYSWSTTQANREFAGGIITVAVMWFLYWAGVREFQAYSHTAVAVLGLYAYWRTTRGEDEEATAYLWALLATATVPLAIEALTVTTHGGLYGWWLLLEQIVIMLLGMSIGRRFVTMWGLYVAVGAVLYQLRSLGYGALALLALFLIGLAVYRLSKKE